MPVIPTAVARFRDLFRLATPWWLSDRLTQKKTVGYRYLWSLIAPLDATMDVLLQGIQAAWPGVGTPTALPYIGRSRGVVRGQADTDDEYATKLIGWLERAEQLGSMEALAREIHEYLGNHPRVRVVNRAGRWVTMNADGSFSFAQAAWDWDSVSNPERNDPDAPWWSEMWVIIYPTQWALSGAWGDGRHWGARDSGIGHIVSREEVDAVKGLISLAKSAHSLVRAVIWTSDGTLFDPAMPGSLPDGTWGMWGSGGSGSRVASGRNTTTCRYWEPR